MSGAQPSSHSMPDRSASGGNRRSYTPSTDPHTPHLPKQQTLPLPFLPDALGWVQEKTCLVLFRALTIQPHLTSANRNRAPPH
jgi:hypothetical protein